MRSGASAPLALTDTGHGIQAFARRQLGRLVGAGLFVLVAFGVAGLATWNVADPSFSHATDNIVTNAMGYAGAVFSDLAMQFFGLAAVAALVPAVIWGFLLFSARGVDRLPKRGLAWFGFALMAAAIAGCVTPPKTWPLPTGLGGVFGDMVLKIPGIAVGGYPKGLFASIIAVILAAPAFWLFAYGSALIARKNGFAVMERAAEPDPREQDNLLFDEDEDEGDEGILALGAITHWWLSFRAWMHRRAARRQQERDEYEPEMEPRASAWRRAAERVESAEFAEARMSPGGRARVEPEFFAAMVNDRSVSVDPDDDDVFDNDEDEDMDFADEAPAPRRAAPKVQNFRSDAATRVEAPAARPVPG
ncbi:DNA translocase FtsK 4TM domain-containing protein, partial [Mesorhizobium sp.]